MRVVHKLPHGLEQAGGIRPAGRIRIKKLENRAPRVDGVGPVREARVQASRECRRVRRGRGSAQLGGRSMNNVSILYTYMSCHSNHIMQLICAATILSWERATSHIYRAYHASHDYHAFRASRLRSFARFFMFFTPASFSLRLFLVLPWHELRTCLLCTIWRPLG